MPTVITTTTTIPASGVATTVTTTETRPEGVAAPAASFGGNDDGVYTDTVAVTGASGFIAMETIKQLLTKGYHVKGTVRRIPEPGTEYTDKKYGALYRLGACFSGKLELFKAELTDAAAFDECFKGCSTVHHIASPFHNWEKDPYAEVIGPATEGTKNVMAAAKKAGVKRVVLTSSVFAIGNFMHPDPPKNSDTGIYTEEDWNTQTTDEIIRSTEMPLEAYGASKPLAEKVAWDFAEANGMDLVTICPGGVFGPPLAKGSASIDIVKGCLGPDLATTPFFEYGLFPCVDVRDVAKAHVCAMENPNASGRYAVCHDVSYDQTTFNKAVGDFFPKFGIKPFPTPASKPIMNNSKVLGLIGKLIDHETMTVDTVRALLAHGDVSYSN